MAAEEERLSAVVSDALVRFALDVAAFTVTTQYACLEVLKYRQKVSRLFQIMHAQSACII